MTGKASEASPRDVAPAPLEPSLPSRRLIASLQWSPDPKTGWPVGRWVLSEAPGAEESPVGAA
jgi:hypothetical protein